MSGPHAHAADPIDGTRLIVFCRRPAPGRTKTRLAAVCGGEIVAALYEAFVADLFETAGRSGAAQVRVAYVRESGGARDDEVEAALRRLQDDAGTNFVMGPQTDGDLGARMGAALQEAFDAGVRAAAIIGTDSPQLAPGYIRGALERLTAADGPRVAIGPSDDGGYVLVGARAPLPAPLFAEIPWSTDRVRDRTLDALRAAKVSVETLGMSFDVDTIADLRALERELASARADGRPVPRRTSERIAQVLNRVRHA